MKKFSEVQKLALRRAALHFGESMMPQDCAAIIQARYRQDTLKKIGPDKIAEQIIDMMTAGGFVCDMEEACEEAAFLNR